MTRLNISKDTYIPVTRSRRTRRATLHVLLPFVPALAAAAYLVITGHLSIALVYAPILLAPIIMLLPLPKENR